MKIQPQKRELHNSFEHLAKAKPMIPACTQTFSKGPDQFVLGVAPVYLQRGQGCYSWDVDGNRYIDLMMGLWSVTLGYGYRPVVEAIKRQAEMGQNLSLMHPLEIEVTELLLELNSWADMVRFGKNGSDVTTAAVKVSRTYTGRDLIVRCTSSYHGWHDWYICHTEKNLGVPEFNKELCLLFDYNDVAGFERLMKEHGQKVACVIMEGATFSKPQHDFLQQAERITHQAGSILIFDEIINGFRFAPGGAREYFDVDADLVCFGKGISNGSPLSALVGKREIMKLFDRVFFSFTFGGEPVSLASAKASIQASIEEGLVQHLWDIGGKLKSGLVERIKHFKLEKVVVPKGYPVRTVLNFYAPDSPNEFSYEIKSLFQQEVIKRGVLIAGSHALCLSHTHQEIDYILDVYEDALMILAEALETDSVSERLEGQPIRPILIRPN